MKKSLLFLLLISAHAVINTKLVSIIPIIEYAKGLFIPSIVERFETNLLSQAYYFENGEIMVHEDFAQKLINLYMQRPENLIQKRPQVIKVQPAQKQISVVQFQVNRQRANSCGYHTIYNLKAVQDLIESNQIVNEKNVRTISKMYFDGYLLETNKREEDITEMPRDEDIMKFGSFAGLKNYCLIHYFGPYSEEVRKKWTLIGFFIIQKDLYFYGLEEEAKARLDVKNSLRNNKLTSFVLRMGAHFVSLSVIKENNNYYRIIYMNSTNAPLYQSEETYNFVEYIKNLIQ